MDSKVDAVLQPKREQSTPVQNSSNDSGFLNIFTFLVNYKLF